ncbi:hypothetical protein NLI96_g2267 [Meripilus lineatus]|uniref:Uncharacterized protein n=1 Tax=Meripilus lineatus TaxID=2056292 RepID=A0AAD5YM50_9APHY|nr:hypothetical protein NLI96_g2267 [Physisporinus lineatus]
MFVMFHAILYAFTLLLSSSSALPILQDKRDVVNPHITSPTAATVWTVGSKQTVTWDTSDLPPPANITNIKGKVILGFLEPDSYNLMLDSPLAQGFSILDGSVVITIPNVPVRTNYIIALMGDSGNISPEFRIVGGSSVAASPSPSTVAPSSSLAPPEPSLSPTPSPPIATKPASSTPVAVTPSATPESSQATPSTIVVASSSSLASAIAASVSSSSSSSGSTSPSPSTTAGTNGAWSSKQIKLSSIFLTALAAVIMI